MSFINVYSDGFGAAWSSSKLATLNASRGRGPVLYRLRVKLK